MNSDIQVRENSGTDADALREQGNTLYKALKFQEAITAYSQAVEAAPEDARPLANLSAVYYEMGKYGEAEEYAKRAIELSADNEKRRETLRLRLAKCALYQREWDKFREAREKLSKKNGERKMLMEVGEAQGRLLGGQQAKGVWEKIIVNLPRGLQNMHEEFMATNFGHDFATSQLDEDICKEVKPEDTISILFGGIGDARHLYATLLTAQITKAAYGERKLHIACTDIKPMAIARLLLVLLILYDIGKFQEDPPEYLNPDELDMLYQQNVALLMYLQFAAVMPPKIYDLFQIYLNKTLTILTIRPMMEEYGFLFVYHKDVEAIKQILALWQHDPPREDSKWGTTSVRKKVVETDWVDTRVPPALQTENALWKKTAVILPPPRILEDEKVLSSYTKGEKMKAVVKGKHKGIREINKRVDEEWMPNLTTVDNKELTTEHKHISYDSFVWDPFEIMPERWANTGAPQKEKQQLYDWAVVTFGSYAKALYELSDQVTIELAIGDVFQQMDELQHLGTTMHRKSGDLLGRDTRNLPLKFDRIHLSNIPDYTGGPVVALNSSLPMLHAERQTSHVTFNIMYEISAYGDNFIPKYMKHHSGFSHGEKKAFVSITNAIKLHKPAPSWEHLAQDRYLYYYYGRSQSSPLHFEQLMSQKKLEDWFYSLFLAVALPCRRAWTNNSMTVMQPHNMTFFFRLLENLSSIGYPLHWLGQIFSSLLSGSITTRARPPKVFNGALLDTVTTSPKRMSILPFSQELRTLASIYGPVLPFGFTTSQSLTPISRISSYAVWWETFTPMSPWDIVSSKVQKDVASHYFLVLVDTNLVKACGYKVESKAFHLPLRDILKDDETSRDDPKIRKLRDEGIHVITTYEFLEVTNGTSGGARFWFDKQIMKQIVKSGKWKAVLTRNDDWDVWARTKILVEGEGENLEEIVPWTEAFVWENHRLEEPYWIDGGGHDSHESSEEWETESEE